MEIAKLEQRIQTHKERLEALISGPDSLTAKELQQQENLNVYRDWFVALLQ